MRHIIIPYTYILKHIPSGRRYYGVRYGKGCLPADLWVTYFSSSKRVKRLILETGKNSFEFQIRRTFKNRHAAIAWEHKVLKRLNVAQNKNWINVCSGRFDPEKARLGAKTKKPWKENDPRYTARKEGQRWKDIALRNIVKMQTPEARAKNRSTDIILTPNLNELYKILGK